tara:strand:- start:93 stop:1826 length:1734 start_codon:yes stop_codon:yes gene_type:complete
VFTAGLQIAGISFDIPNADAVGNITSDITSTIEFTEVGSIIINYNMILKNSGTSAESLNDNIVLYLPLEYKDNIKAYRFNSSSTIQGISFSTKLNNTLLTLNTNGFSVSPNKDEFVNIELILMNIVEPLGREGMYFANVPFITTSNLHIDNLRINLRAPNSAPFYNISDYAVKSEAFSRSQQNHFEVATVAIEDVTKNDYREESFIVLANPGIKAFSILQVDSFIREIYISNKGEVMIRETIEITNSNFGMEMDLISLDLVGDERDELNIPIIRNVTSVPNREPALTESRLIILENTPANRLDLKRIVRHSLDDGNTMIIKYEYRLGDEFIQVGTNSITANIETKPTIRIVANEYKILITESNAFSISSESPFEVSLDGNQQIQNNNITITYVPGIAWASNTSLPIGTAIFVIALLGMMTKIERKEEGDVEIREDDIVVKMNELTGLYSEEVSLLKNIIERLGKWNKDEIKKSQIENVKSEIRSIRTRNVGKLALLRNEILELKPSQKELFNNLNRDEQSLERDIFQIIQLYEQYRLNRINSQDMENKLSEYKSNVLKKINDIVASIQSNVDSLKQN